MKLPPRLHLPLRPSRAALAFIGIAGTSTVALVLALPWPSWMGGAAAVVCGAGMLGAVLRVVRRSAPALLVVGADRRVAVTDCDGVTREGRVLDATYVGAVVIALAWRPDGGRVAQHCLVLPDVLGAPDRRALRVWLRYGRVTAAIGESSRAGIKDVQAG